MNEPYLPHVSLHLSLPLFLSPSLSLPSFSPFLSITHFARNARTLFTRGASSHGAYLTTQSEQCPGPGPARASTPPCAAAVPPAAAALAALDGDRSRALLLGPSASSGDGCVSDRRLAFSMLLRSAAVVRSAARDGGFWLWPSLGSGSTREGPVALGR